MSEEAERHDAERSIDVFAERAVDDATPRPGEMERMDTLSRHVLPALIARLGSSRLGELEVRSEGWRVRLRRATRSTSGPDEGMSVTLPAAVDGPAVARSPAVGYFTPGRDLAVGLAVSRGDRLGTVDVLGIEQEVTAPADGFVGRIDAEPGQAVEYGQPLASISATGAAQDDGAGGATPDGETVGEGRVSD